MGRYKDYDREPKRGGYDDDQKSDDRASGVRPNYPSPSATQASGPVEAIVKWFNAEKGFGFVAVVGGSEAFMHIRQLEAAGHSSVPEGARVKVRIGQGQKGPEVTEVIEVDPSTAQVTGTPAGRSAPRSSSQRQPVSGRRRNASVRLKCTMPTRGLASLDQDGGGKDVFVHATTLERGGLSGLAEGQRVRMQIGQGQKGPGGSVDQAPGLNDHFNPRAPIGITAPVLKTPMSRLLLHKGYVRHPPECQTMPMLVISRTLASAAKLYGGCPPATHRPLLCSLIP